MCLNNLDVKTQVPRDCIRLNNMLQWRVAADYQGATWKWSAAWSPNWWQGWASAFKQGKLEDFRCLPPPPTPWHRRKFRGLKVNKKRRVILDWRSYMGWSLRAKAWTNLVSTVTSLADFSCSFIYVFHIIVTANYTHPIQRQTLTYIP